ncbi:hypothetical protein AAC387_Pa09g1307 [Persea americana]
MDAQGRGCDSGTQSEEEMGMRRGPWSMEEDFVLVNYITKHGEGRWNSLARCAGLKRTGKSCRLRWLNYLRPDVRRGNITLEEQLLILELHSRWGNRWSKIAQYLPGRTDNEIKNYWRTRVQKQAKQLKCDVNSKQFKDAMRYVWIPRLLERIQAASSSSSSKNKTNTNSTNMDHLSDWETMTQDYDLGGAPIDPDLTQDHSSPGPSSDSIGGTQVVSPVSDMDRYSGEGNNNNNHFQGALASPHGYFNNNGLDFSVTQQDEWFGRDTNAWSMEDLWAFEQQLCSGV